MREGAGKNKGWKVEATDQAGVGLANLILIWTVPSLTRSRNLTNSGPKTFKGKSIRQFLVYFCVLRKGLLNAINRTKTLSQHCGVPLALRPASAYRSYIQIYVIIVVGMAMPAPAEQQDAAAYTSEL